MRNARSVVRPRARWLILLLAALLLASCADDGAAPDSSQLPLEQQSADDESDWYYVETPEDCLADEEFDPVDELCYVVVDCEAEGDCEEEGAGFAQ